MIDDVLVAAGSCGCAALMIAGIAAFVFSIAIGIIWMLE